MVDLVAFLRARLDEDEHTVVRTGGFEPDRWTIQPSRSGRWSQIVPRSRLLGDPPDAAALESDSPVALVQNGRWEDKHIARWDPERVLADVAAKRTILAMYERAEADHYEHAEGESRAWLLAAVVAALTWPYADHPDYNKGWRLGA